MLLCEKTLRTHGNHHQVTFKLAYIHKTIIVCTKQNQITKKRNRAFSDDLLCAESAFTKSVVVSVGNSACQQWKFFADKHGMKTNGQYY